MCGSVLHPTSAGQIDNGAITVLLERRVLREPSTAAEVGLSTSTDDEIYRLYTSPFMPPAVFLLQIMVLVDGVRVSTGQG